MIFPIFAPSHKLDVYGKCVDDARKGPRIKSLPFALSLSKGCPFFALRPPEGLCFDKLSTNGEQKIATRPPKREGV
jgi:hypothetical protein